MPTTHALHLSTTRASDLTAEPTSLNLKMLCTRLLRTKLTMMAHKSLLVNCVRSMTILKGNTTVPSGGAQPISSTVVPVSPSCTASTNPQNFLTLKIKNILILIFKSLLLIQFDINLFLPFLFIIFQK